MFGEEKLIYFKECFVNEKSTYFCLNQKQISIILYFSSTALLKKIADMPGFHRYRIPTVGLQHQQILVWEKDPGTNPLQTPKDDYMSFIR